MKSIQLYILSLWSVFMLSACNHKELCIEHPHLVPVCVNADWSKFGQDPMNMTVMFYPQDGGEVMHVKNYNPRSARVQLAVNTYDVLVFNEQTDDFGNIKFRNMEKFATAEAYVFNAVAQPSMKRTVAEMTQSSPDHLGVAIVRDFQVTQEMLDTYSEQRDRGLQIEENVLTVYPENKIYTIDVKIYVSGIQYVRSVVASLSGLAEGYMMGTDIPASGKTTHVISNWQIVSTSDSDEGYLHGTCLSFGLPAGHTGEPDQNILSISALLVDNETVVDLALQVGDKFEKEEGGYRQYLCLELGKSSNDSIVFPKVKPEGTMEGNLTIDPSFEGDHSVEFKNLINN